MYISLVGLLTSAPFFSNILVHCKCPAFAANSRGVSPSNVFQFTSESSIINKWRGLYYMYFIAIVFKFIYEARKMWCSLYTCKLKFFPYMIHLGWSYRIHVLVHCGIWNVHRTFWYESKSGLLKTPKNISTKTLWVNVQNFCPKQVFFYSFNFYTQAKSNALTLSEKKF